MSNPDIPTPEVTPVTPQIAPTSIVEPLQAPIAVEAPILTPVAETPPAIILEAVAPVIAPVEAPKPAATVIGQELDKKPVEAPVAPVTEIKPVEVTPPVVTEGGQSDEPAPPPKYEPFTLPEGITLDEGKVANFTSSLLTKLETEGKVPHEFAQKFGQDLVDLHVNEVTSALENLQKTYSDAWENQKVTWKDEFLKDPEIGGNRWQTTIDSALTFIRTHGGTSDQQTEFRNLMESSGLGNHPAMIRLLASAGRAMSEGRPLTANRPVSPPKSKVFTMYGNTKS